MRTVLRCVPLFTLFGLLAVSLTAPAAENGTTRAQSRSHVATIPGAFDGTVKTAGFVPKHLKTSTRFAGHVTQHDVVEGGTYYEDPDTGQLVTSNGHMGEMMGDPMGQPMGHTMGQPMGDMGCADGSCGSCGDCAYTAGCLPFSRGHFQVFAGVQGYTGPANLAGGGSFGFNEGLNWGTPLPGLGCWAGQVGVLATQANLSGSEITDVNRNQGFLTVGLFRRVDQGLQGGVVVDYMRNSWYRDMDLTNVRGEFSWVHQGCQDIGFWFTTSTKSDVQDSADGLVDEQWEPTDLFAIFFRRQFGGCEQGEARLSVGWSDQSDGYLAVDTLVPLTSSLSMEANFAYLIPEQGKASGFHGGHNQESWNIGIGLVWYPGRCMSGAGSYYRPLFRVADNSVFMLDRVSP